MVHEYGELIAADAAGHILRTELLDQQGGHPRQHPVSDVMAPGIIDALELIHVNEKQGLIASLGKLHPFVLKGPPVIQPRQGIVGRLIG